MEGDRGGLHPAVDINRLNKKKKAVYYIRVAIFFFLSIEQNLTGIQYSIMASNLLYLRKEVLDHITNEALDYFLI